MRKPLTIICFFMLLFCLPSLRGQNLKELVGNPEDLSITADHMEADVEKGVAHAKGKVQIRYGQLTVKANEASLNQDTKDFSAKAMSLSRWTTVQAGRHRPSKVILRPMNCRSVNMASTARCGTAAAVRVPMTRKDIRC